MRGDQTSPRGGRLRSLLVSALAVLGLLATASSAFAVDHRIKVREVFAGTTGSPKAEFVELQMVQANQNQVAGNKVTFYNAAGTLIDTATFASGVAGNATQSSILVGTTDASSFFGVPPDLTIAARVVAGGGQVCYEDVDDGSAGIIDCASWGGYGGATGTPFFSGTPFNVPKGIIDGRSMLRDISAGDPGLLELGDDTDNSAADFDEAILAIPRNNAGATTTTAGSAAIAAGVLTFTPAAGVVNKIVVARTGTQYTLTDSGAPVVAGAGCTQQRTNVVRCPTAAVADIDLDLGDRNDRATIQDTVDATVRGGIGDDRLISRSGDVVLDGGANNDTLDPGTGTDVILGGNGQGDVVTYASRGAGEPVVVDIDGVADDGNADDGAGTRDNVGTDVERLIGGEGADTLTGSNAINRIVGRGGEDDVFGLAGSDHIHVDGDGQVDTASCGQGVNDHIRADAFDVFPVEGPDACEFVN